MQEEQSKMPLKIYAYTLWYTPRIQASCIPYQRRLFQRNISNLALHQLEKWTQKILCMPQVFYYIISKQYSWLHCNMFRALRMSTVLCFPG